MDVATLCRAGFAYHQGGKLENAASCYETALVQVPDHAEALHLLGLLRLAQGRAEAGIALLRRAAERAAELPAVWYNLGLALRGQRQDVEAIACLQRAVALNPSYAEAHLALGAAAQAAGQLDAAIGCYRRALAAAPREATLLTTLGTAFGDAWLLDEAVDCFLRAAALEPTSADAHGNLGIALQRDRRLDEATESFRRAVALRPDDAAAQFRLGVVLGEQNRLDEAIACYRAALALRPDDARVRSAMALLLLRGGDFAAGWREYERRWAIEVLPPSPHATARPMWRGEALAPDQTLLLYAEQGFGDTLQFVAYAPHVVARGGKVLLEVHPGLQHLLATIPGLAGVFERGEPLPPFDLQCPLLSLPFVFATRLETIPQPLPLAAPADRLAEWASLGEASGARRIGITWSGNPEQSDDRSRSMALALFRRILDVTGCRFHLLQPELRPADEAAFSELTNVVDYRGRIRDFADTAAIISHLDLVITADTAVAHLAGAMGRPVWILLPFAPDWRWLLGREDSPWYPTARLFRQQRPGDWAGVLERVRARLGEA